MIHQPRTKILSPQLFRAVAGALIFLSLWYLLTEILKLPRFKLIPDPVSVIKEWVSFEPMSGRSLFTREYYIDIAYSVGRTMAAFTLATVLGVTLGLLMGWNRILYDFTFPLVEILRPMPPLSWIPLAVLILPGVEFAVVYVTFIAAFFATVLNTLLGVFSIDRNYFLAARCLGSKPKDIFLNVVVPGSLPFIFTGLQISMGISWMSLVAGEIISGQRGLGYAIYEGYFLYQFPQVISYMFTLGILGYISSAAIRAVGRKLMAWEARRRGA
ncbi:MAG: ABC transporter permease [Alphaproteobacteria bacterium]|uniref:ABC transporter permease n=1 Tax=Candidatus Nitrobium versatile TaxID=2884831 RepID=A0A953J9F8_9BACT|nr:ABC transporter permease [Candidatus Nitrobium versatile]